MTLSLLRRNRVLGLVMAGFSFLNSPDSFSQQAWTQVPVQDVSATRNILRSIAGTSSSDVWAAGHFESISSGNLKNLLMHWDGTGWQTVNGLDLSGTYNDLWDITVVSPSDIWAVGTYNEPGTSRSQLVHWNGSTWTHTSLPFIAGGSFLNSIDAISGTDIWAVGGQAGSPIRPPYTIHFDGSNWTEFPASNPGTFRNYFSAVDGIASNDVWAVGYQSNAYGDFHAMAQHWNGSIWTNVSIPASISSPLGELTSVTMIASNNVWALGSTITGVMLMMHWDGNSWSQISSAGAAGGTVISRGVDVFSVGDRISQWNGNSWTVIDSLNQLPFPALVSAVSFANGDIWTSGRTFDTAFHSLVYRTANATPQFTHGSSQVLYADYSAHNIDELLKVEDADISQLVVYSILTPPSHGVLSGLPDTAITSSGFAIPTAVNYTRTPGYANADQFVVKASVGRLSSVTTINIDPMLALPVVLSNYSVFRSGQTAIIEWTTASELNTKEFLIERSGDGMNFIQVGQIATLGTGSAYRVVDQSPMPGWNYYRLVLVDINGPKTTFPVRSLKFEASDLKPFVVRQNPVLNKILLLQLNRDGEFLFSLYDVQGRKLMAKNLSGASLIKIALPANYTAGIYIMTLSNKNERWTGKILLE